MYKIVREKVLDLGPSIGNNLVGLAHDMTSSLTGENIGLIAYIRENYSEKYIFDLEDPCHCLNLVIKKSMDTLQDIHIHFSKSPQRVAILSQIQKNDNLNPLSLCHYAKTRCLSLG